MQKINIIEDFYSQHNYGLVYNTIKTIPLKGTYQPKNVYYPSRLDAYPCWESDPLVENDLSYSIFKQTFEQKTNIKVKKIESFYRKIIKEELKNSPFADKHEGLVHKDSNVRQIAGLIYFDSFSLKDGTRFYSYDGQVEPDIIIGSRPNRCVFYPSNINHSAGIDWRKEDRSIQVFFLEIDE